MSYITRQLDERVVEMLSTGAVGFMPSDTVYGLSCIASSKESVERIYELKQRDLSMPFIVLLSDVFQLKLFGIEPPSARPAIGYWPAPLSVVFQVSDKCPSYLHRGTGTIALRIPDNDDLRHLIEQTGPLVSTSANYHGRAPCVDITEAQTVFGDQLDFFVDLGPRACLPSTLARLEPDGLVVLRQGSFQL